MGVALLTLIKMFFAILVIPVCYALTVSFAKELPALGGLEKAFMWGGLTYVFLQLFFYSPQGVFQFGQKIFGDVFKTAPVLAAIVPLFLPIIPTILLLLIFVLTSFFDLSASQIYLMFFVGFSLAMHLILSAHAEFEEDDNVLKPHYLFLMSLTYIVNLFLIASLFNLNFPAFSVQNICVNTFETAKTIYIQVFQQLFGVR